MQLHTVYLYLNCGFSVPLCVCIMEYFIGPSLHNNMVQCFYYVTNNWATCFDPSGSSSSYKIMVLRNKNLAACCCVTTVQKNIPLFISVNRSTCFVWYLHPSSGAHVTVSTASGIGKTVTKSVPVQSRSRQFAVTVLPMPDAVDTVAWAPDDGWKYHTKHVERFTDINKLYMVYLVGQLLAYKKNPWVSK